MPSHYLNQGWNIVNWTLKNKIQWNFNLYLNIFIQENAFENVVCEMAAILCRPQCVNTMIEDLMTSVRYMTMIDLDCRAFQISISWLAEGLALTGRPVSPVGPKHTRSGENYQVIRPWDEQKEAGTAGARWVLVSGSECRHNQGRSERHLWYIFRFCLSSVIGYFC